MYLVKNKGSPIVTFLNFFFALLNLLAFPFLLYPPVIPDDKLFISINTVLFLPRCLDDLKLNFLACFHSDFHVFNQSLFIYSAKTNCPALFFLFFPHAVII